MWDEITVPIKYGSDYRLAKTLFHQLLMEITGGYSTRGKVSWAGLIQQYRVGPRGLDPQVFLAANDKWMEFTPRYVVDYKKRRITKDLIFTRLMDEIERTEGRVALTSAVFHLVEAPEIKVNLVGPQPDRELQHGT